ncbi:MAG: hypothetical protein FWF18_05720 [Dehalococcoidia bacterium]|nr:hypothetical protein [Dehalococcoidia bacterium]
MKHRTLRLVSTLFMVMAWVTGAAIAFLAVLVGINAAAVLIAAGIMLGGFILAAFSVIILLTVSRLILLLIDVEQSLADIAGKTANRGD